MKFYVLLSLIIFCCSGSFAQGLRQTYDAELYSSYEIDVKRKGQYMLNFGKEVTSVSFSTYEYDFEDAFITVEKDTFLIEQDIHFVDDVGAIKSSLIVLDDPCGYFVLHAKGFKGLLEIHLNHLKPFAETEEGKKLKKKSPKKSIR